MVWPSSPDKGLKVLIWQPIVLGSMAELCALSYALGQSPTKWQPLDLVSQMKKQKWKWLLIFLKTTQLESEQISLRGKSSPEEALAWLSTVLFLLSVSWGLSDSPGHVPTDEWWWRLFFQSPHHYFLYIWSASVVESKSKVLKVFPHSFLLASKLGIANNSATLSHFWKSFRNH